MEMCSALAGYAHLVELFRVFVRTMAPNDAINAAVEQCIAEGMLVDYLQERRSEVISTFLTEWDEEGYRAFLREESREDGRAEGEAAERARVTDLLVAKVRSGAVTLEDAAEVACCPVEEFARLVDNAENPVCSC